MVPEILAHSSSVSIIYLDKYLHSDLFLQSLFFFFVLDLLLHFDIEGFIGCLP